jgi:predicted SAM-dependent methyltransferase
VAKPTVRRVAHYAADVIRTDLEGLADQLPFILDRLSEVNAANRDTHRRLVAIEHRLADAERLPMSDVLTRIEALESQLQEYNRAFDRLEFVRREILHEVSHGAGGSRGPLLRTGEAARHADPPEEILRLVPLRLNLGCGHLPLDGYVNCDARPLPGVDLVADVTELPFPDESIDEIRSAHLLEHFPQERLRRSLLPAWRRLLKPGAAFVAVVPDAGAMVADHLSGATSFEDLRLVTFGEQEYEGDYHYTMFSPESLVALLEEAGFADVRVVAQGRRNGVCREMEVHATRPAATG